jgi:hypothetical protein
MTERLPPPPFWRTRYYDRSMSRPDRQNIRPEDVQAVHSHPTRQERQADGRTRLWGWIEWRGRWLRVIIEPDGETVHNALWDRRFRP